MERKIVKPDKSKIPVSLLSAKNKEEDIKDLAYVVSSEFVYTIKHALKERNLTPAQLAQAIEVSPSYVSQIFNGTRLINISFITKIRIALSIPLELVDTSKKTEKLQLPTARYAAKLLKNGHYVTSKPDVLKPIKQK